ncbi:MAG TPA: hypothetical protein VF812_08420 [Ktedonobacterales bacterium]
MARREQTGTGGARRGRASGGRAGASSRKGRARRGGKRASATRRLGVGQAESSATHATATSRRPAGGSAWSAASALTQPSALLTLAPERSAGDVVLTLTGAQHINVSESSSTLDMPGVMSGAGDPVANRMWRRPGGLTRMAGL